MDKPRICRFPEDDEDDEFAVYSGGLASNPAWLPMAKSLHPDKSVWYHSYQEDSPASSSGAFRKLLQTTACRKPEKFRLGAHEAHKVQLNLHQFQSETGDTLGEDPDSWARLTF